MTIPSEPPQAQHRADKPLPLQLELPPSSPQAETSERVRVRRTGARWLQRRTLLWVLALSAALGALTFVLVTFVLPWYVRRQCIDQAAAHGIALSVDAAHLDVDGFRLVGVGATFADVPSARAQAPEVRVQTSALRPQSMTVKGAELTLDGPWANVATAIAKWRASPTGGQEGEWVPTSLVIEGAHVAWQKPLGDNGRLEANDVHAQVAWRGREPEIHMRLDRVSFAIPGGVLGPWRVDVDRVPATSAANGSPVSGSSRVRVALDPAVPDASTVLVVGDGEQTSAVDISIPRSPMGRLGIPPQLVGLHGRQLQLEVSAHYGAFGPSRAQASTKGGIYGVEMPGISRPLDIAWDAAASGAPAAGLDVRSARLAVGPLVGSMTGTLKAFDDDGFRLDLAWGAGPVPCQAFETPLGAGAPFDIAYTLRKLSEVAGIGKVDGQVTARARLGFDSRDLGLTRLDFEPNAKCRIALFP